MSQEDFSNSFIESIKDEKLNFTYLQKQKFEENLNKLIKKLKNKTIVLYGAGIFFEVINKHFDLKKLNIIGITDKKYFIHEDNEVFLGYKIYSIDEIKTLKPDFILVTNKFYVDIINDLTYNKLKNTNIKIKPLVKKTIWTILQEIWKNKN